MVWAPELGLKTTIFNLFTREWSEGQSQASRRLILPFHLFTWRLLFWGTELGPKTAHFTFIPFHLRSSGACMRSRIRSQDGSFYLSTWWWSEVQNQASGLTFYLILLYLGVVWDLVSGLKTAHFTFLAAGVLRDRIRLTDGSFYISTFYQGLLRGRLSPMLAQKKKLPILGHRKANESRWSKNIKKTIFEKRKQTSKNTNFQR